MPINFSHFTKDTLQEAYEYLEWLLNNSKDVTVRNIYQKHVNQETSLTDIFVEVIKNARDYKGYGETFNPINTDILPLPVGLALELKD